MDASVEAIKGDIVINVKKFLVEQVDNEISVSRSQNFIYTISDTVGEGHGSKRGKAVINLILDGTFKVSDPNKGK